MGYTDEGATAPTTTEADARVLEAAAAVLQCRFGMLTAGDLISGLATCAGLLRSGTGIIRPAQPEAPRNGTLERPLDEPWGDFAPYRAWTGSRETGDRS